MEMNAFMAAVTDQSGSTRLEVNRVKLQRQPPILPLNCVTLQKRRQSKRLPVKATALSFSSNRTSRHDVHVISSERFGGAIAISRVPDFSSFAVSWFVQSATTWGTNSHPLIYAAVGYNSKARTRNLESSSSIRFFSFIKRIPLISSTCDWLFRSFFTGNMNANYWGIGTGVPVHFQCSKLVISSPSRRNPLVDLKPAKTSVANTPKWSFCSSEGQYSQSFRQC